MSPHHKDGRHNDCKKKNVTALDKVIYFDGLFHNESSLCPVCEGGIKAHLYCLFQRPNPM